MKQYLSPILTSSPPRKLFFLWVITTTKLMFFCLNLSSEKASEQRLFNDATLTLFIAPLSIENNPPEAESAKVSF